MAGPWERYQRQQSESAGPWSRYASAPSPARQPLDAEGRPVIPGWPENRVASDAPGLVPSPTVAEAPVEPISPLADAALSFGTGTAQGAVDLLAFPAAIQALSQQGIGWAMNKGEEGVRSLIGAPPIPEEELRRRARMTADVGSISSTVLDARNDASRWVDENLHQPQTTMGEFAKTAGEFVPGAVVLGPAAPWSNALRFGIIPGIVSEGLGQITRGSTYEGLARLAGGVGGGLVGGVIRSPASFAEAWTGRAASGVTPQQFQRAEQIIAEARSQGIDLTAPEAIQAATGGGSRLGSVMRVAEGTTEGGALTAPFFAARPSQIEAATSHVARQIAPDTATPSYQGTQLRDAAERALYDLERQRTLASTPFYQRAVADTVPGPAMRSVLQGIDDAIAADKTGIISNTLRDLRGRLISTPASPAVPASRSPVMGPNGQVIRYTTNPGRPAIPEAPNLDIGNLDRVRKYYRDRLDLPQVGQDAITKEQGAAITRVLDDIDRLMLQNSPDLAAGRATHQALSESLVNPAQAGPLGAIARTEEVPTQANALMPRQPLAGSVPETSAAARALASEAPDAARGVVRQGYERDVQRGLFNTAGLPDEYGGARVAGLLRQNNREANVLAAIEATAGRDVREQVERLTDTMAATGWRYRPGSPTAFNAEGLTGMREGGLGGIFSSIAKPATAVKDALNRVRLGGQAERLASLLLSGEPGVRRIAEMAARIAEKPVRDAILRALVTTPATTGLPGLPPPR